MRFTTTTRVRYAETDRMGIVYHAHYVVYFELGRTEAMRSAGIRYREMEDAGYFLAVVEAAARYRKSARYDDLLTIETRLTGVSGVQVRFEYRVLREGELLCTGHTVLACVGGDGRPRRIPEPWRSKLVENVDVDPEGGLEGGGRSVG